MLKVIFERLPMRQLIYLAVFRNKKYLKFLELFFSSIVLFNQDCLVNTDFLVITEKDFVEEIQQIGRSLGIAVHCWVLPEVSYAFATMIQRYMLPSWSYFFKYTHILYCDTDILIANGLQRFFTLLEDPTKFYTLKEGTLEHEYWGGDAVFDFKGIDSEIDPNTPGVCAGVFLFQPNEHTVKIFQEINKFIYKKMATP